MKTLLDKLSKEDLIIVIANMHDIIQEWNNGWGLSKEDAEALINIGRECTNYCGKENKWKLPDLTKRSGELT